MLLANLVKHENLQKLLTLKRKASEAVSTSENAIDQLMDCFVKGAEGALNKRGGTGQGDAGDLQVYLFDHALLMVKQKSKHEQSKVYRRVSGALYVRVGVHILISYSLYH